MKQVIPCCIAVPQRPHRTAAAAAAAGRYRPPAHTDHRTGVFGHKNRAIERERE